MSRPSARARGAGSRAPLILVAGAAALASAPLAAQTGELVAATLDPMTVTATRSTERAFDLPVAIDVIGADAIQRGQLQINLSESLARVPGMVVQSRWNYAQDLQLSIRGFGARANFGVRGVRLYQDGIPATMPDGQGQTGSFSLASAERIEVLRGPFSALYGNAAGGVISVFTEDGPTPPRATMEVIGGSYATWNAIAKLEGEARGVNFVAAANHFATDGYRQHSQATRDLGNVKLAFAPAEDTRVTVIANTLSQPEAQDPLGLTRAQWEADPRQSDPAATRFDTRKTVRQTQVGATVLQRLGAGSDLVVTGYGGTRQVRQYLALPGTAPTSSGGVTDLDRGYGGLDARLALRFAIADRPASLTLGANYETQSERRRGYVNDNGIAGELRRDEDNAISNTDGYAQFEWWLLDRFSVFAGFRYSDVRFRVDDAYVTPLNPDDSGRRAYNHGSPVFGVVWSAGSDVNVYANYGEGFETPTFAEVAYQPIGSGLNLGLQPAVSVSAEVGLKALFAGRHRINLAAFNVETTDEIVINTATGGRTTYKNAAKTRRRGAEAAWEGNLGAGFTGYAAYTYLSAKFATDATTGSPPLTVPAGASLPGVPGSSAYVSLSWSYPEAWGLNAAVEVQYAGKVYVNDRNTDAAPSYTVGNLRVGFEQRRGGFVFRQFARLNNVTDVDYVGSVIVGDTNGRYFEPAATRNFLVGLSASATF
jgi:iron complex outermembrane receptor protein